MIHYTSADFDHTAVNINPNAKLQQGDILIFHGESWIGKQIKRLCPEELKPYHSIERIIQ